MRIGEVADAIGLEASAIRYYESNGIVPKPERTASGYRDYGRHDFELLGFVRRLRALELPLDDVKEIVSLRVDGQAPCTQVREAIAHEAGAIDKRIADLISLRDELARLQKEAEKVEDDWPRACVCHVIEPQTATT